MRRVWLSGLMAVALLSIMAVPVLAQGFTLEFDENGNGLLNGAPLAGSMLPNPSNDGGGLALTYIFGPIVGIVGNGDVLVYDDFIGGTLSDAIRFTDDAGNLSGFSADRLIFYSDLGGSDLADTGFPANLGSGATGFPVLEGPDGTFVYNRPYQE
jgi:hypothetical protein